MKIENLEKVNGLKIQLDDLNKEKTRQETSINHYLGNVKLSECSFKAIRSIVLADLEEQIKETEAKIAEL